jgi:hypothetical protein
MKKVDISTKKYPNIFALVDDEDYERLNKYKWYAMKGDNTLYVVRAINVKGMKQLKLMMHREVMRYVGNRIIDHRNLNGLDNQKLNLRLCTPSQNAMNAPKRGRNKSGYKGVSKHPANNMWVASICKDYKIRYLGSYKNKIDASEAYNQAAKMSHGEFAYTSEV